MKINVPAIFRSISPISMQKHHSTVVKKLQHETTVSQYSPIPLQQTKVQKIAVIDSSQPVNYHNLPFQSFTINQQIIHINYLNITQDQVLVQRNLPLSKISVPVKLQFQATKNIFKKFSNQYNLLKYNTTFDGNVHSQTISNEKSDFILKCSKYDEILEDIHQEMLVVHQEMQIFFNSVTIITDQKYAQIYNRLNQQDQQLRVPSQLGSIRLNSTQTTKIQNFILYTPFSAQTMEFDYNKFRKQNWPNNTTNHQNIERIFTIKALNTTRTQKFYQKNFLLHQPYKQSLDDIIDFIFSFKQYLYGQITYRKLQRANSLNEKSNTFKLSIDTIFNGCITNIYDKSAKKISFLQSLFPLELINVQKQEDTLFSAPAPEQDVQESSKPAKSSLSFFNFEDGVEQIKASDYAVIRNKFKKINFTDCTISFTNQQYLVDFNDYYEQFMGQYNVKLPDDAITLNKLQFQPIEPFMNQFYSKFNYSKTSANYKQFAQNFDFNSSIFASGFLDFSQLTQFNFNRPNTPRSITDVVDYKQLYQHLKQLETVQLSFEMQNFIKRQDSVFYKPDQLDKLILDNSDSASTPSPPSNTPPRFIQKSDLAALQTSKNTFNSSIFNLSQHFYGSINITRFSNLTEIMNDFLNFSEKLSNIFAFSINEIMKKIIESTYWGAVSVNTQRIYDSEQKKFIQNLSKKVHDTYQSQQFSDEKITHRPYEAVMFEENQFEIQRVSAVKFQKFVNFYIKNHVVDIGKFIVQQLIGPFLSMILGVFYGEIFANLSFSVKLCEVAQKISSGDRRFLLQKVSQVDGILAFFKGLVSEIFLPYKQVNLISSMILNDKVQGVEQLVIEEVQEVQNELEGIIQDVESVLAVFESEFDVQGVEEKVRWFLGKHCYKVSGVSFQDTVMRKK